MAVTLTPGMESRLEGAPGVDLFADDLENRTQFWISQGADPQEARQLAAEDVAKMRDRRAREAEVASQRDVRESQRAAARMPDQRPIPVQEADLEWRQDLADQQTREYRQSGMGWAPDSAGQQAQDMQRAITPSAGVSDPFIPSQFDSQDPIKDDRSVAEDFQRRYGRPPRSQTEVDNHRQGMIFLYQSANNTRPTSQAPGRWGSQEPFNSPQEEEAYSLSRPGAPSQEEADMYASDTPMVLTYKNGRAGPMIAAPAPEPGETYIDADGNEQRGYVASEIQDGPAGQVYSMAQELLGSSIDGSRPGVETPLPGVANAAFGPARAARGPDYPNADIRTGMRDQSMPKPGEGYVKRLVNGPSGPQWVWDLSDEKRTASQEKRDDAVDRNSRRRYMAELGMSPADAEGKTMEQLRELALAEREAKRFNQKAEARRIITENARMNSGQLGLQMQQMDPEYRQIMLLDRLTQGRRGGATPLDVQAQNMENAMPVIRSALAGAMQSMDPQARSRQEMQTRAAIIAMPPEQQVAFSRMQGEQMGTGYSAAHVGERWRYWMLDDGHSSRREREKGFRKDMTDLGYSPEEIDAFIDSRMNSPEGTPEPPEAAEYPQPEPGSPVLPSPTQPPSGRVWTPFGGMRR